MTFDCTSELCWRAAPFALLIAACSPIGAAEETPIAPSVQAAADRHPESGLEIIEVAVVKGDKRIVFKSELANTPESQAKGLMFRTELGDDEGMLFPSETPAVRSFWMKNTPIALDIIFIGPDRRITNIETAVPYSLDSVPSNGDVIAVFEIRGGLATELGIEAGDQVEWSVN